MHELTPTDHGFAYLHGDDPYSDGVAANPGFEIVHTTLANPLPWRVGFDAIARHLAALDRPMTALCAVELRCPAPFTFDEFSQFNSAYREVLDDRGLLLAGGVNPLARTNVAPQTAGPAEVVVHGFSFTSPARLAGPTFVASGAGELEGGNLDPLSIVRPGDTSADGMAAKARHVLETMSARLAGLGATWADVTNVSVYTATEFAAVLGSVVAPAVGVAAHRGVRWYPSRPPVTGLEFEMDLRGVRLDAVVDLAAG